MPPALPPRPPGTRILAIEHGDGVTVMIPPAPMGWRLRAGLIALGFLSVLWLLAVGTLLCYAVVQRVAPAAAGTAGPAPFPGAILILGGEYLSLAVIFFVRTLCFLKWRLDLTLSGDYFRLRRRWALREVRPMWPRDAIRRIYVESRVREAALYFEMSEGPLIRVRNYRGPVPHPTAVELERVAAVLRHFLARTPPLLTRSPTHEFPSEGIAAGVLRP